MKYDAVPGTLLFEDQELIVWNKPHDIPTSGRSLEDEDCVQYHLMKAHGGMVWAVHQLDADTTGINVFTKAKKAVSRMQKRMRSPRGRKAYLCVLDSVPSWDSIVVDAPIGRVNRTMCVTPEGKEAKTRFTLLSRGDSSALVKAELFTGRTHQIRVHLQHLGLSLFGEEWYRDAPCTRHPRQALHAWTLDFDDDETPSGWVAPFPADLVNLCARLQLPIPPSVCQR